MAGADARRSPVRDSKPGPDRVGEPKDADRRDLSAGEQEDAERRSSPRATVVHEAIRREGLDELSRAPAALAWSGLAAGLSMGFSLVAEGLLRAHLPAATWAPLIAKFGYSVGFVLVVMGRQQLFTENTLTVIIPLLHQKRLQTLLGVIRLWAVVLVANLVGAFLFASVLGRTALFDADLRRQFEMVAQGAVTGDFGVTVLRGVFAGWLIALMVWLLPTAESARLPVIVLLTYLVALGGFAHIVAGSVEAFYLVVLGRLGWGECFGGILAPTLLGNIAGGVALVAALNHAQVAWGSEEPPEREPGRKAV